jgi:hypothetical protein
MFSTKQFDKVGGEIHIKLCICTLTNQWGELIVTCKLVFDLYKLGVITKVSASVIPSLAITHNSKIDLWHQRLGHIS